MTIGELSTKSGVPSSAIRYYESLGLLKPAGRKSARRVYDASGEEKLAVIVFAKKIGFSLAEIRQLLGGFTLSRWRPLAERKIVEIGEVRSRLETMEKLLREAVRCGCVDVEACGRTLLSQRSSRR